MSDQPSCRSRDYFAAVEDPRIERCKRHQLLESITTALCGITGGAERWAGTASQWPDRPQLDSIYLCRTVGGYTVSGHGVG